MIIGLIAQTYRNQGFRGFYTGIVAQIMRDIPFYATFFGTYEVSCRYLRKYTKWEDTAVYFVSGGYVRWVVLSVCCLVLYCTV